jgi:hypothetical protein
MGASLGGLCVDLGTKSKVVEKIVRMPVLWNAIKGYTFNINGHLPYSDDTQTALPNVCCQKG